MIDKQWDRAFQALQQEMMNESIEPYWDNEEELYEFSFPEGFCVPGKLALELGKVMLEQALGPGKDGQYEYHVYWVEEYQCYLITRFDPSLSADGEVLGAADYVAISQIDGRVLDIGYGL